MIDETVSDTPCRSGSVFASLRGVEKTYGEKTVLNGLSLDIYRGETLCLLGESGGGKTTLLNILARLIPCDKGEVVFCPGGRTENGGSGAQKCDFPRVSYAFQDGRLLPNLSALENLTFAGGKKEYCKTLLSRAALAEKDNVRPSRLSGGEKQRVSLLRAFAAPFDVLLADEPFSALDLALKEQMIRLFKDLLRENAQAGGEKTAVVVTHSVKEALELGDRAAVLKGGAIVAEIRVNRTNEEELLRARAALVFALTQE